MQTAKCAHPCLIQFLLLVPSTLTVATIEHGHYKSAYNGTKVFTDCKQSNMMPRTLILLPQTGRLSKPSHLPDRAVDQPIHPSTRTLQSRSVSINLLPSIIHALFFLPLPPADARDCPALLFRAERATMMPAKAPKATSSNGTMFADVREDR